MDLIVLLFEKLNLWVWWVIVGVFLIVELLMGMIYFFWLVVVVFLIGFIVLEFVGVDWIIQLIFFVFFLIVLIWVGDCWVCLCFKVGVSIGFNDCFQCMIGQCVIVVSDFVVVCGWVKFGDIEWVVEMIDVSDLVFGIMFYVYEVNGVILCVFDQFVQ